ncbi:MAG: hypothetical protein ACP5XB_13880, partial [Isosphaeraceae bacterium]
MEFRVTQQMPASGQAAAPSRADRLAELTTATGRATAASSVTRTSVVQADRIQAAGDPATLPLVMATTSSSGGEHGWAPVPPASRLAAGGGVIAPGPTISPGSTPHSTAAKPGAIRPLSMAPTSSGAVAALTAAAASAGGQGPGGQAALQHAPAIRGADILPTDGSGGSGGGNSNVDPRVIMSGGYTCVDTLNTGIGSITTPPVSIGTYFDLTIMPPANSSDTLKTVTVKVTSNNPLGYLGISDYFNVDPNKAPPVNQKLYTNINTNPAPGPDGVADTHFVVDADPATYSVLVNVTYNQNNDSGTTIIGFTSHRPTATMELLDQGTTKVDGTKLGLDYDDQGNPNGYTNGITLYATTTPISYQTANGVRYVPSDFMFMQTVQMQNSYQAGGRKFVMNSPDPSTPSLDNGLFGGAQQIGFTANPIDPNTKQFVDNPPAAFGGWGWALPWTDQQTQTQYTSGSYETWDTPNISVPQGTQNLQVFTVGSAPPLGACLNNTTAIHPPVHS